MQTLIRACGLVGVMTVAATTQAEDFGSPGQVVIGAERLTGVYSEHLTMKRSDTVTDATGATVTVEQESKLDTTQVSLLGMSSGLAMTGALGPATIPRLAFDVFVIPGLSLGGSVMYLYGTGTEETNYSPDPYGDSDDDDQPDRSTFLLAPRVGYAIPFGPTLAIWPRGGVTYTHYSTSQEIEDYDPVTNTSTTVERKFALDFTDVSLEAMLVVSPVPSFAILVGPYVDIPLGGGAKTTVDGDEVDAGDPDYSYLSFGLSLGIAGYL